MSENVLCKFGVISDSQYVDADDCWDFRKENMRYYRHSLAVAQRAAKFFEREQCAFVMQLGDLLDGKTGQLENPNEAIAAGSRLMLDALNTETLNYHHLIGNHELYLKQYDWPELTNLKAPYYYAFMACANVKILVLNSFAECTFAGSEEQREAVFKMLEARNHNDLRGPNDWTAGLEGLQKRFVPYNGSIGADQRAFIRKELLECKEKKLRCIVMAHVPLSPGTSVDSTLAFDFEQVQDILHDETLFWDNQPSTVAIFAGHDHRGGYAFYRGIFAKTWISPLNCNPQLNQDSFSVVEVYEQKLVIRGIGLEKNHIIKF